MKRSIIALLIAIALIVFGTVLAGCSLWNMRGDWDPTAGWEQFTGKKELVNVQGTISEEFTNIDMDIFWIDVELLPSPDGTCYFQAAIYESMPCTVTAENGTLKVHQADNRRPHEHIGINWNEPTLKLYLPADTYDQLTVLASTSDLRIPQDFTFKNVNIATDTGDATLNCQVDEQVNIATDTGDIHLDAVTCDSISVSTDTGFVRIQNTDVAQMLSATSSTGSKVLTAVKCGSLKIESTTGDNTLRNVTVAGNAQLESDTGDWELENVIVSGDAWLDSSTGDWELNGFDAANITIRTDTGDVEGTLLSDKIFFADSDTGDVEVPRTTSGGTCEITTSTGDIEIDIVP